MLQRVRNTIFFKSFWFLLSFYMLNISVEAPESNLFDVDLNSSNNVQDSIVEICLEVWMGFGQVIPDVDESNEDYDLTLKKKGFKNFYIVPHISERIILFCPTPSKLSFFDFSCFMHNYDLEIHAPPPDCLFSIYC